MLFRLFLVFTIVPIIELVLLIEVGGIIGTWNTIFLVVATAAVGAYMVRMEGFSVIARLRNSLAAGIFPTDELLEGTMILVAGALLLTPGFFTDVLGFLLVFPPSRRVIRTALLKYIRRRMANH